MDVVTGLFLLVALGLTGFHFYVRCKRTGRLASKVPGPAPYPFIGNMLDFDISSPDFAHESESYRERLGVRVSASLAENWPSHEFREKWYQRRKVLTPTFHFNILKKYLDITQEQGESLVKYLKAEGKESTHTLIPLCSRFTLNVICESALGVALDKIEPRIMEDYKKAIYKIGNITVYRMPRPYIHDWMLRLCPFLPIVRDQKKALNTLHIFTNKVVKERREYHNRTENKYLEGFIDDVKDSDADVYMSILDNILHRASFARTIFSSSMSQKRMAMLDLLLSAEKDGLIDDEGIKEEVDTFTFEGHDTTAMAMTFTLMLLAENKEAQETARAEVTEILKKSGGKIAMPQVQEMHYLERCIRESIRLYPPVPTIFRHVTEDLQLKHALIPADSHVICHFYDLHRDPNFWSEPDRFNPDRFLLENVQKRHPFAYLPFSAGARNCIGQKFAMNELKSLIGQILHHFHLEPVDRLADVNLIADLILRPFEPLHIKFIEIEKE